jgi:hypothetical protein
MVKGFGEKEGWGVGVGVGVDVDVPREVPCLVRGVVVHVLLMHCIMVPGADVVKRGPPWEKTARLE